jgi:16S rRNA (guanine1207-N2)-methyltransferase
MPSLNPTSALLAGTAKLSPGERVLLLHIDDPALARWAVECVYPHGQVIALHSSHRALTQLSHVSSLTVSEDVYPDPACHGLADVVLLNLPKGREHVRAYLWTAAQTLRPGGRLFLSGPNAGGAKSAIKDAADLFGAAPVLGLKSSCRIAQAVRPPSVTLPADWIPAWEQQTRLISRPEGDYTVVTMPGVFSWDHLDSGTELLLGGLRIDPAAHVLDIGCGYGMIGLVAARAGAQVVMVDEDLLAVRCARASVIENSLTDRCTVLASDVTSAIKDQRFSLVLTNPPFHQGIDVSTLTAQRIVREAYEVLEPGGRFRLVANRFLPYQRTLRDVFGNVTTIAETGQFYVLEAAK